MTNFVEKLYGLKVRVSDVVEGEELSGRIYLVDEARISDGTYKMPSHSAVLVTDGITNTPQNTQNGSKRDGPNDTSISKRNMHQLNL